VRVVGHSGVCAPITARRDHLSGADPCLGSGVAVQAGMTYRWLSLVVVAACTSKTAPPPDDPCSGSAGTFHNQSLVVDGDTRAYYLHVPPTYDCSTATALLVDFHGTGFDLGDGTPPEELWGTPGLEAASDALGFIAVRPRSQSFVDTDGTTVYHWDSAPGDLEINKTYAHALVAALAAEYNIDPARVYASGFSNGTNMASQFIGDAQPLFSGIGLVGGGIWATYTAPLTTVPVKVYDTTGFRDQLRPESLAFYAWLAQNGFPASQLWVRDTNAGHEVYGWHFQEMMSWFDRGVRPAAGTLATGWSDDGLGDPTHDVLHVSGSLAVGTNGHVWQRSTTGWTQLAALEPDLPTLAFDGACTTPSGDIVATGDGAVALFAAGAWSVNLSSGMSAVDDEDRLEAIACVDDANLVGGGPSYAAASTDLGQTWGAADLLESGSQPSITNLVRGPGTTWVAAGAYYIGRSSDGIHYAAMNYPTSAVWMYGVSPAGATDWWIVGEAGTVLHSTDDGVAWSQVTVPTVEDLYAVAFFDAERGMVVGLHGAALLTTDGGATWQDVSTGLDAMNSDVTWLDAHTVLVVGENGTAITRAVP
jgi:poly(3-hydroxybutyrate) depolymerase